MTLTRTDLAPWAESRRKYVVDEPASLERGQQAKETSNRIPILDCPVERSCRQSLTSLWKCTGKLGNMPRQSPVQVFDNWVTAMIKAARNKRGPPSLNSFEAPKHRVIGSEVQPHLIFIAQIRGDPVLMPIMELCHAVANGHRLTRIDFLEQTPSGFKPRSSVLCLMSPYSDCDRRQGQCGRRDTGYRRPIIHVHWSPNQRHLPRLQLRRQEALEQVPTIFGLRTRKLVPGGPPKTGTTHPREKRGSLHAVQGVTSTCEASP